MPVMDEFKEERAALKNAPFKEKFAYFCDYYKWQVIVTIAIVVFVVTLIVQIVTRKEIVFYAAVVNGLEMPSAEEYVQGFSDYAGVDTDTSQVLLDASLQMDFKTMSKTTISASQKLVAYIAGKDIDILIADETIMENYANNETFYDLREFLSPEQYAKYEPYFYYIDQAVVDEKNAAMSAMDTSYVASYPDPRDPDAMQNPVPVGIYLDNAVELREKYYYADETDIILSVIANTERSEITSKFIDFVLP